MSVSTARRQSSKLAIIVGINEYDHDPLRFAVNDATEMAALLSLPEYGYETRVLVDTNATRSAILTEFDRARINPPDSLLFYFSGHGYTTDWHRAFLATSGAARVDEGLDLQHLAQILQTQPAPTNIAIAIIDCCHAGAATAWDTARPIDVEAIDTVIRDYSETRAVFAACRPEQDALSAVSSPHGAFTHHILQGLMGGAANYRGNVTLDELVTYVRRRMDMPSQITVYRCDSAGSAILGSGLEPVGTEPLSQEQSLAVVNEAKKKLFDYQQLLVRNAADWLESGFGDSCRALRPLLRWFDSTVDKHPEVTSNQTFREERSRIQSKLAQLQNLEPGLVLDGRRVVECLGNGGFGSVWLLGDKTRPAESQIAYKVFNPNELGNTTMLKMFERGYRAMEQLNHERVVRVHGKTHAPLGFFMDYVEGRNLRAMQPPTDDPLVGLRLLVLAAETIRHAHNSGVVHRDIKPENLLAVLRPDGTWLPFLTDFDLAWFSTASKLASQAMANLSYGAPEYLQAPLSEQAHRLTVDVYSFAQLAFYVMTAQDPAAFQASRNVDVLRRRIANWSVGSVAQAFQDWYEQCSSSDPRQRPQNFEVVIDELVGMESSLTVSASTALSRDGLLSELAYSMCGLPGSNASETAGSYYWSVSGQTQIEISVERESRDIKWTYYDLKAGLRLQQLAMSQDSNVKARNRLNARVDSALRGYEGAKKNIGAHGAYEVFIHLPGVVNNIEGVRYTRSVLQDVISAIERG